MENTKRVARKTQKGTNEFLKIQNNVREVYFLLFFVLRSVFLCEFCGFSGETGTQFRDEP